MMARALAAAALATALAAAPAAAQLYRWTDGDGITRYTNDLESIPPPFRAGATDIGSPSTPPPTSPPAAVDPTVIPFTAGAPIRVAVMLNGVPLTLALDTGADRTVISPTALGRAGIEPVGRAVQIVGITGGAAAREVMIERLDIAGTRIGPLPVVVHDVGQADIDGLLGRDVLDYFTLTVDTAGGRAVLKPR
jgi:hypothetical protein